MNGPSQLHLKIGSYDCGQDEADEATREESRTHFVTLIGFTTGIISYVRTILTPSITDCDRDDRLNECFRVSDGTRSVSPNRER